MKSINISLFCVNQITFGAKTGKDVRKIGYLNYKF